MKIKIKELESQSYEAGLKGFKSGFNCAPHSNRDFMITVPHCSFGDTAGCKRRAKMYQAYINGWTYANLNREG